MPKVLQAYMGEVAWLAEPTRGQTAWPPQVLAQHGGMVAMRDFTINSNGLLPIEPLQPLTLNFLECILLDRLKSKLSKVQFLLHLKKKVVANDFMITSIQ